MLRDVDKHMQQHKNATAYNYSTLHANQNDGHVLDPKTRYEMSTRKKNNNLVSLAFPNNDNVIPSPRYSRLSKIPLGNAFYTKAITS